MVNIGAEDVVQILDDRLLEQVRGDEVRITGFSPAIPGAINCLSFASSASFPGVDVIAKSDAAALIVDAGIPLGSANGRPVFIVQDPRREFIRVMRATIGAPDNSGIHPSAVIDAGASIGEGASVGAGAVIEAGVVVGNDCVIGPHCVLRSGTHVGDRTHIGPGVVIGEAGFGYVREPNGTPILMPHIGGVIVGHDVEIGANAVIDRGALSDTVLEAHVKIDNLVHIAHNCWIGSGALIIGGASVSGSVKIGPGAWIAPNATIAEHTSVGEGAKVGLASVVLKEVDPGATVFGNPARVVARRTE